MLRFLSDEQFIFTIIGEHFTRNLADSFTYRQKRNDSRFTALRNRIRFCRNYLRLQTEAICKLIHFFIYSFFHWKINHLKLQIPRQNSVATPINVQTKVAPRRTNANATPVALA
jgi:hypothetical protein